MSKRARIASAVTNQLPLVELSLPGAAQPLRAELPSRVELPPRVGLPPRQGLYDPANEHDACGVGMVVDIAGRKTHQIVRSAIEIL